MSDIQVYRKWRSGPGLLDLLAAVRASFAYGLGDDRATGYLHGDGQDWPAPLAECGPVLLADLKQLLDVAFTHVAFQAYLDGSGCDWHTDSPFDAQAILSLGVTRTFGLRRPGLEPTRIPVNHGDLLYMPPGFQHDWQHCIPTEDITGERISLVFRTVARS